MIALRMSQTASAAARPKAAGRPTSGSSSAPVGEFIRGVFERCGDGCDVTVEFGNQEPANVAGTLAVRRGARLWDRRREARTAERRTGRQPRGAEWHRGFAITHTAFGKGVVGVDPVGTLAITGPCSQLEFSNG